MRGEAKQRLGKARRCLAAQSKGTAPRGTARRRKAQQSKGSNDINMKNEKMKDSNLSPQCMLTTARRLGVR